jgi:glucosamine kinase
MNSDLLIAVDGGGSGIRIASNLSNQIDNVAGFSHGEKDLAEYLSNAIVNYTKKFPNPVKKVVLATATLPANEQQYRAIAVKIRERTRVSEIWICSDSVSAAAAAIKNDGVAIAAGTGITAMALGKNRTMAFALSGDGYLIGDEGSAYWIGKMGLNQALRSRDGRGGDSKILESACKFFNSDAYHLAHVVHELQRPVHEIAKFAEVVSELAQSGNSTAQSILNSAADEIALIAKSAKEMCQGDDNFEVALLGGVLKNGSYMNQLVLQRLNKLSVRILENSPPSIDGAMKLANMAEAKPFHEFVKIL